ncbi:GNAT family N-acetyltransferase [Actinacidiphila paucisporea]|uniref:Protein N-acetyltransferase, RimJ/RimL family n=1 Tax=Actinacidiphila paucisporea TaxID=310782 RepID=A0A1M7Q171_9ACTN|nr:GNAT family N-acetyltransferase [Actinacidiphila paucisporea]SHN23875.1 Protein N-acetyltransferase, RimJ/RimL family [Actinacidiphila paucisporea]
MTVELTVPAQAGWPGLLLRPWAADDAEALAAEHQDPDMRRWLMSTLDGTAAAREWIDQQAQAWEGGLRYSFAVVERDAARPVGHVAVKRKTAGAPSAEIGYWTAAAVRGRGIAPLAVGAVTGWALGSGAGAPALSRLELLHAVPNTASCRVAVKSGFPLWGALEPHPPKFPHAGHIHVCEG